MDVNEIAVATALQSAGVPVHVVASQVTTLTTTTITECLVMHPTRLTGATRDFVRDHEGEHEPHVPASAVITRVEVEYDGDAQGVSVVLRAEGGPISFLGALGDLRCFVRTSVPVYVGLAYAGTVAGFDLRDVVCARVVYTLQR